MQDSKFALYLPLTVVACVSAVMALGLAIGPHVPFMEGLMGSFLCLQSALQILNLKGFAKVFSQYDPLAARNKRYGFAYPFLMLALGFIYLSGLYPDQADLALLAALGVNTAGVAGVVKSGRDVRCGCMGASFIIPVGRVTLLENMIMMAMAAWNLWMFG